MKHRLVGWQKLRSFFRIVRWLPALLPVLVAAPLPAAEPANEALQVSRSADNLLLQGQIDAAIAAYGRALEIDPNLEEAYENRADAYMKKRDYDRAAADLSHLIEIGPEKFSVYANRGVAYEAKGDDERAIADFSKALEIRPEAVWIYNKRGLAFARGKQYDKALADFSKAIATAPQHRDAYFYRARINGLMGRGDDAVADFTKALSVNPQSNVPDEVIYNERGVLYHRARRYADAIADYTKAVKLNGRFAVAFANRAEAYYEEKNFDRAREDAAKAQSLGFKVDPRLVQALSDATETSK